MSNDNNAIGDKMSNTHSTKKIGAKKKALAVVDGVDDEQGAEGESGRPLTAKQAAFIEAFGNGKTAGNALQSAIAAGYSEKCAGSIGAQLLELPKISEAIDGALRHAIGTRLTVKAVLVIESIIDDKDAPLKLRGDMAAKVIEFSGLVERTKAAKGIEGGKKLAEMSRAELEAVVSQGAAVLHAAASLPAHGPLIEGQLSDKSPTNSPTR